MQHYTNQLLADIAYVTENVSWPFAEKELHLWYHLQTSFNTSLIHTKSIFPPKIFDEKQEKNKNIMPGLLKFFRGIDIATTIC